MKILIVEDDLISRQLMKRFVENYGDFDIAVNGNEAVQLFQNSLIEEELYDIIFLDVMMPEMDGYSALKNIREMEEEYEIKWEQKVKIVMTTTLSESHSIIDAFKAQCDEYLVKPIDKDKVDEILQKMLK